MISIDEYTDLCKKFISDGYDPKFIIEYEEIMSYIDDMLTINTQNKEKIHSESLQVKASHLFALKWGLMILSINEKSNNICLNAFKGLFLCISNTILAITKLAQEGFDYQATVLIRNLYELCFTLLAIIIDPTKRTAFINGSVSDKEYETWKTHFTFSKLDKTIQGYEKTLNEEYEDDEFLNTWRKKNYKKFSSYVHNDFLSLYLYGYTLPSDDQDNLNINLWGAFTTRENTIAENINSVLFYTELLFLRLIVDKNIDITKEYFCSSEEEKKYWDMSAFIGIIAKEYYMALKENE